MLNQLKRVVVKVSTRLLQHLHQQQLQAFPPSIEEVWGPFTAKLKMMAEDLPSIITKAVKSSNKRLQDEISTLQEENRLIRI